MSRESFATDNELTKEMHSFVVGKSCLGVVLVSCKDNCKLCGHKLILRSDQPSHVTVYSESFGTIMGTHYHKYCSKGCAFRQYYGYYSEGNQSTNFMDTDWAELTYFISSSETAIEMKMLRKFDCNLLLGQISYAQKTEIYNYSNCYDVPPKQCCSVEKSSTNR